MMDEKKITDLQNKVVDFKRFAFILLALTGFLTVGLILPTEAVAISQQGLIVGLIFVLLSLSFFFHRSAMIIQQKIFNEEF